MSELAWQACLLLAVAFFFGAVLACGLKRHYYYSRAAKAAALAATGTAYDPAPGEPRIEVMPGVAVDDRFDRAISGRIAAGADRDFIPPTLLPDTGPKFVPIPRGGDAGEASSTGVAAAVAGVLSAGVATAAAVVPTVAPNDDFARIRGIDEIMQKQLHDRGITTYAALAALNDDEVKSLENGLGVARGRAEADNWIRSAQVLAAGGTTYYALRADSGVAMAPFSVAIAPATEAIAVKPIELGTLPRVMGTDPHQDLTRIYGVDSGVEAELNRLGVVRYEHVAALNDTDVQTVSERLELGDRIASENWRGQARVLAEGGTTYHMLKRHRASASSAAAASAAAVAAVASRIGGRPVQDSSLAEAPAEEAATVADELAVARLDATEAANAPATVMQAEPEAVAVDAVTEILAEETAPMPAPEAAAPSVADLIVADTAMSANKTGADDNSVSILTAPADDFTRIRAIDAALQDRIHELGITRFYELASLSVEDVEELEDVLEIARGRVAHENWLQQAHILATGGETYYARRADSGNPVAPFTVPVHSPGGDEVAPPTEHRAEVPGTLPREISGWGPSDDLTRVRGIDAGMRQALNELGIRHFQQLASLNSTDVANLSTHFGLGNRITNENWLGQAAVLARGGETYYARRRARAAEAAAAEMVIPSATVASLLPETASAPEPEVVVDASPVAGEQIAESAPAEAVAAVGGIIAAVTGTAAGVAGTASAADAPPEAAQPHSDAEVPIAVYAEAEYARASAEALIEQPAEDIAAPVVATPEPIDQPAAVHENDAAQSQKQLHHTGSELGAMRSVRSEALLGEESRGLYLDGKPDDLKRIRGVGLLIERKLHELGIYYFEQIANWSVEDVESVSNLLDFRGRIERENWIEQARILSSGGQTEFSRRGDS